METTNKIIKSLRQKSHWNQGEVAKRLKISIPAYSKIEAGITVINLSRLFQIAELFDVSPTVLINGPDNDVISDLQDKITFLELSNIKKDAEIIKLQRKIIDLYEEVRG